MHVVDALTARPIGSNVTIARDGKQVAVSLPQIGEGVQFYRLPACTSLLGPHDAVVKSVGVKLMPLETTTADLLPR